MSTLDETTHDSRPAAISAAVALAVTGLVVATLLWRVADVVWPVGLGVVGAVFFALSCWLLSYERFQTVSRPLVSVLTLPVALGLFGSTALAVLLLASRLFPVTDGSLFSTTALVIAGEAGVVFGSVLALLGVSLGVRSVVTPVTLRRYANTTFLTALVPGSVCIALVVEVVVFQEQGPLTAGLDAVGLAWRWVTAADGTALSLSGVLFTLALALTSALAAVVVLPVAEVLGGGSEAHRRVDRLRRRLTQIAAVVIGTHLVALGLELSSSEAELAALFTPPLYGFLDAVSSFRPLRFLLVLVVFLALAATVFGGIARRLAQQSSQGLAHVAGPFTGGALITLVAVVVAEGVYHTLLELVLESLPPQTEQNVETMATEAASLYGEALFVALLAFALVTSTLCFIVAVRIALYLGYLSEETPGFSFASLGLFVGVVAAATLSAPVWLVLGGVVCSLLVWDVGRFGSVLGTEIGPGASSRDTQLLHAGATLGVGLIGAVVAVALLSRVETVWSLPSPTTGTALVSLSLGLVCFVIALR